MKTTMTIIAAALTVAGMSGAQAAAIVCGDASLGIRTVTVNPALACTGAGLTNLGDPQLVTYLNGLIGLSLPDTSTLVDRDTANSNGGVLNITGVNGTAGGWSFASSVWDDFARVFLYFHFGDAQDNPSPTSTTDPDIFIVELNPVDITGSWAFNGQQGLSNIALLGSGEGGGGGGGDDEIPEPGMLFLMGAGLLGLGMARRRKSA